MTRASLVAAVAAVVSVAAILGGAFFPGPRLIVGVLLAIALSAALVVVRGQPTPDEWLLLAFIAWGCVSALGASTSPLAARETVAVWIVAWVLWHVARQASENASRAGLVLLTATAVILAVGVALEALGSQRLRVGGLLENPNITAAILVVALPATLALGERRRWWLTVALTLASGVVLTGSRAGLLAMLGAAAVILPRGRVRLVGLIAGGVGGAMILVWRFVQQPDILAWFRPSIWLAVLRLWWAHPIAGVGPGGLVDASGAVRILHPDNVGQHQFSIAYAESSPLAVLVQTGVVGVAIVIVAAVLWWRGLRRRGGPRRPLAAALAASVVMAAFHDLLTVDVVLWWWALTVGFLEGRVPPPTTEDARLRTTSTARLSMGLVFAFVVLWGVVEPTWARWLWRSDGPRADRVAQVLKAEPWFDAPLEWRSRDLLQRETWTWDLAGEAIATSGRAVRIHPGAARLWSVHGVVQGRVVTDLGPWPDSVDGARGAFARAVELEPHQPWTWLEWARLERNLGRPDAAVPLVQRALEEEPHTVRAWLLLARLQLDRGENERARQAYERALASVRLRSDPNLNAYERELVSAPGWQFRELEEALR